jgi:hypothetical protein
MLLYSAYWATSRPNGTGSKHCDILAVRQAGASKHACDDTIAGAKTVGRRSALYKWGVTCDQQNMQGDLIRLEYGWMKPSRIRYNDTTSPVRETQ